MKSFLAIFFIPLLSTLALNCSEKQVENVLDKKALANRYFKEDAQWYYDNIPFFECSNKEMEAVYYYRWKMYKAHIRNVGKDEFVITEFINHVSWDREPYCTINAASMHHIYEGRWLRDPRFMDGYIRYLYQHGGNDRRYSESIADASYARYLVNADQRFLTDQLDSMVSVFNKWEDHWDDAKRLYYIPAMPDATEYTIASIDASGGKDGFEGGDAFRPTINSYMFGNARAISKIAALKGDSVTSNQFNQRSSELKKRVEGDLWNDSLQHFCDRFKVDNEFVDYWEVIRGRELAGLIPWYFNLPSKDTKFQASWKHALDTTQLLGAYGFRTNEPSYQYYFKQYVFFEGKRGSQWNGPSWPYQSSQVLTGLQNFLQNYDQHVASNADYVKLLNLYTMQHYLPDGKINLVENYDPNYGGPIVHYYWSNHYNHSSYNNLIVTGLCGIQPSESDTLTVHPLFDDSITYFCLDDVNYHGHRVTVVYDKEGTHYNQGKGLSIMVDGKKAGASEEQKVLKFNIGSPLSNRSVPGVENVALNISKKGFPVPSASVNIHPDSIYQAVDGRIWFFSEITNCWNTAGSNSKSDWYAIDFGQTREISGVHIHPLVIEKKYTLPEQVIVEYNDQGKWTKIDFDDKTFKLIGNTMNRIEFKPVRAEGIRFTFSHPSGDIAVSEFECF